MHVLETHLEGSCLKNLIFSLVFVLFYVEDDTFEKKRRKKHKSYSLFVIK